MRDANVLEAAEKCLEALPDWNPGAIDPEHSVIVTVDMNIGFTREGALASSRVNAIVPAIAAFLQQCRERKIPIVGVTDSHPINAVEFASYPVHCVEGTAESEFVPELREFPEVMIRKNSTNAFFAPEMAKALGKADTVVIIGCCTDICIEQFAVTMKAFSNQENRPVKVIVPRQLVETYDAPGHDAELMGTTALMSMLGNGIEVVNYRG